MARTAYENSMIARMNQGADFADGGFGDAADVVGGRGKIAQHDGGGPPEGNEGQHDSGRDDDLDGGWPLLGLSRKYSPGSPILR